MERILDIKFLANLLPIKYMRNRNVTTLWLAQLISSMGDAVYQLALIWLILDLTGSTIITGLVAMSAYLPAMLFGLLGGVFADKYNRLTIMHVANISQSLTVMIIPLTLYYGTADALLIGILAFFRSSFGTMFPPALYAFIPGSCSGGSIYKSQFCHSNQFTVSLSGWSCNSGYFIGNNILEPIIYF